MIIERLTKLLSEIPVDNRPTVTPKDVLVIEENIKEAYDIKHVRWDELSDNRLKYELCVHFGWLELQENYDG